MQTAICDDDPTFREETKNLLLAYKKEKRVVLDIVEFACGEELLLSGLSFDMVLLDYRMPGRNGLEIARELRKANDNCCIIFVTQFCEFILDSFEVQPFRFLCKPLDADKLYEALDSFILSQKELHPVLIDKNGELITVPAEQIIYVEGDGKNCIIRTMDSSYRSAKTVSRFMDDLPLHCFYRIHKSYVVNMKYITAIIRSEVTLVNGEKACISRNRLADFKKAYKTFLDNFYIKA